MYLLVVAPGFRLLSELYSLLLKNASLTLAKKYSFRLLSELYSLLFNIILCWFFSISVSVSSRSYILSYYKPHCN